MEDKMKLLLLLALSFHTIAAKAVADPEAEAEAVAEAEAEAEADPSYQYSYSSGPGSSSWSRSWSWSSSSEGDSRRKMYSGDANLGEYGSLSYYAAEGNVVPTESSNKMMRSWSGSWASQDGLANKKFYSADLDAGTYGSASAQVRMANDVEPVGQYESSASQWATYPQYENSYQDMSMYNAPVSMGNQNSWQVAQPSYQTYSAPTMGFNNYNQMYTRSYTAIPNTNCMNVCSMRRPQYYQRPSCNVGCNVRPACSMTRPNVDYQVSGNTLSCRPRPMVQSNYNPVYTAGGAQTLPAPIPMGFGGYQQYQPVAQPSSSCFGSGCAGGNRSPQIQVGGAQTLPAQIQPEAPVDPVPEELE